MLLGEWRVEHAPFCDSPQGFARREQYHRIRVGVNITETNTKVLRTPFLRFIFVFVRLGYLLCSLSFFSSHILSLFVLGVCLSVLHHLYLLILVSAIGYLGVDLRAFSHTSIRLHMTVSAHFDLPFCVMLCLPCRWPVCAWGGRVSVICCWVSHGLCSPVTVLIHVPVCCCLSLCVSSARPMPSCLFVRLCRICAYVFH